MPEANNIIIIGAGGHGRVCADVATAQGLKVLGFIDSSIVSTDVNGYPILGREIETADPCVTPSTCHVFVAIGDNRVRRAMAARAVALGYTLAVLKHPSVIISPTAEVGPGTVLMPGVIVNANTSIGRCCIVNTAASVDHDNHLADGVQLSPGVHAAGTVTFGEQAFIGTGAAIKPGVVIGAYAIVGAGAAVIRDVPAGARVGGVPARPLRQ